MESQNVSCIASMAAESMLLAPLTALNASSLSHIVVSHTFPSRIVGLACDSIQHHLSRLFLYNNQGCAGGALASGYEPTC